MPDTRKNQVVDCKAFESYLATGWQPIPLHPCHSNTVHRGRLSSNGKRPIDKDWTHKSYDAAAVIARCGAENRNMGIRPGKGQMIIDVDPRHGGNESWVKFCSKFRLKPDTYPRVRTGAEGSHFYVTYPADVDIVSTLKQYPGLEFRSVGHQCVAAGSIHPETGKLYRWDFKHPPLSEAPELPASLIEALRRENRDRRHAMECAPYSAEQIKRRLSVLDPIEFRSYGDWIKVGMAVKHAGGEDAYDVWRDWNARDPSYADAEEENRQHWASFTDRADGITYRTLDHLVREAGHPHLFAQEDFENEPIDSNIPKPARTDGFKVSSKAPRKGEIIANDQDNIRMALRRLGARVRYDEFSGRNIIDGLPAFGPHLDDAAMDRLWLKVDEEFGFRPPFDFFETVVKDAARRQPFHPAKDYFAQAQRKWDGKPRLDRWLIDYAGAEDMPYVRAVSALPLIAAVRRTRHPGSKYDEMLVLESSQGQEKSSALEILALRPEWFSDSMPLSADNKQVIESLSGKLIVECADLHGLGRASIDHVKALLSRTVDRARMAYGRTPIERPRQSIFIGTANNQNYLRDTTGNRRFWPVAVKAFDLNHLRQHVEQLWGEAAAREMAGESIRLDPALWGAAGAEQRKRTETATDPYTEVLQGSLANRFGKIAAEDVWKILGLSSAGMRTQAQMERVGAAMRYLNFERRGVKIDGRKRPGYVKGSQPFRRINVSRDSDGEVSVYYDVTEFG